MKIIKETIGLLPLSQAIAHLIGRLPEKHPQKDYLENQLHRKTAGEHGESKLRKKFVEFHLDETYVALWDIGLKKGDWITQFDGLVLTEKCIIILDSKNVSDDLHYNEKTDEFFRMNAKGKRLILDNPSYQLKKNILFLKTWLEKRKLDISVKGLVVYTANNCFFHSKPAGALICKTYQMNEYLYKILQPFPQESASLKVNKIKRLIEANHTPYVRKPLCETYQIDYGQLKRGVHCLNCKGYQVVRSKRNWICRDCNHKNAFAHRLALQEYFSIVDSTVTNKDFRDFSLLESDNVAKRILMQYDFSISGENKARRYQLKE